MTTLTDFGTLHTKGTSSSICFICMWVNFRKTQVKNSIGKNSSEDLHAHIHTHVWKKCIRKTMTPWELEEKWIGWSIKGISLFFKGLISFLAYLKEKSTRK